MLIAEHLLTTLYELENIESRYNWDKNTYEDNPPRYYRLQQIKSMLKFLNYDGTPKQFVKAPISEYIFENEDVYIEILNNMYIPFEGIDKFESIGDIVLTYWYLYEFRKGFHNSLRPFILSEGVGNYKIGEKLMENLRENLPKQVEWIDNLLFFVIDPKKHEFNKEILIKEYGYPDVNIYEIDSDNI